MKLAAHVLLALAMAGCGSAREGGLGEPCYPNGTCDGALQCSGERCERGTDSGGPTCGDGTCAIGEETTCPADCCLADCADRECGDDGCGGSCGKCPGGRECSANGECRCIPTFPTDCAGDCFPPDTDCSTMGFCNAAEGCLVCDNRTGGAISWCCGGSFVCCSKPFAFACDDGLCYADPAGCPGTLCPPITLCP